MSKKFKLNPITGKMDLVSEDVFFDETLQGTGTVDDPIGVVQLPRTTALSDSTINLTAAEDFERTCGPDEQFSISNPVLKKPFRLKLTGGTLNSQVFLDYSIYWMSGQSIADYDPASENWLYCEIRDSGKIYLFWESKFDLYE